jgi:hypothetical protein
MSASRSLTLWVGEVASLVDDTVVGATVDTAECAALPALNNLAMELHERDLRDHQGPTCGTPVILSARADLPFRPDRRHTNSVLG